MTTSPGPAATSGTIAAPFVPMIACRGKISNSASSGRWLSVRYTTSSPAERARASSRWITGTIRCIDGPQYSAPPSWTKSSIMSTTTSARFTPLERTALLGRREDVRRLLPPHGHVRRLRHALEHRRERIGGVAGGRPHHPEPPPPERPPLPPG